MDSAPATQQPRTPEPAPGPAPRPGSAPAFSLRRSAANFWLRFCFVCAHQAPWVMRATRGFFLWHAWTWSRHIRQVTDLNARHLLGSGATSAERAALGKRVLGSFFDFIYDIGRTAKMNRDQLEHQIASIEGLEAYTAARRSGRGAIIATAHMGSFELGMVALQQKEQNVHVVFQRDAFSHFEKLRSEFRARLGIHEAAVDDGWAMWLRLRDALRRNEAVAIQADRVMPGQRGVKVPLLDGHALFPDGPAKLAAITGAPIIPIFSVRQPDGKVRVYIEKAIEVPSPQAIGDAILQLSSIIGQYLRKYPDQWLVLHRAWCEDQVQEQEPA